MGTIPVLKAVACGLVALLAAGCFEPLASPPAENAPRIPPPIPELANPGFLGFEGCAGAAASLELPYEVVRAAVPAAFRIIGYTPETASVLVRIMRCDRIATNASVHRDAAFFEAMAYATPANRSWAADGTHYYLLDTAASDPVVAEYLAARIPSRSATFEYSQTPADVPAVLESWKVDGASCILSMAFVRGGEALAATTQTFQYWSGAGPFLRTESRERYGYHAWPAGGALQETGSCGLGYVPAHAFESQSLATLARAWSPIGRNYT